jgi:tetrahydromethanopterin S-methyltransferase subunit E
MELGMIALGVLAAWGAVATLVAAARDGYSRVPTRTL